MTGEDSIDRPPTPEMDPMEMRRRALLNLVVSLPTLAAMIGLLYVEWGVAIKWATEDDPSAKLHLALIALALIALEALLGYGLLRFIHWALDGIIAAGKRKRG